MQDKEANITSLESYCLGTNRQPHLHTHWNNCSTGPLQWSVKTSFEAYLRRNHQSFCRKIPAGIQTQKCQQYLRLLS